VRSLRHYWRFVRIGFASQAQYGVDFFIGAFGVVLLNLVDLVLLGVLLQRFTAIGGWNIWEIVFLFSFYLAAMGLQNIFTVHLGQIEAYVQDGTLDQFLVRPSSPLIQLMGREINHGNITHVVTGVAGIVVAYGRLGLHWTFAEGVLAVVLLVCGALVLVGLVLGLCSLAFWTIRSREFLYGTLQIQEVVQHYPVHIFGRWFQVLVTGVLPFAFINYYPTLVLLGRTGEAMHPLLPWLSPLAGVIILLGGIGVWKLGLSRYQSTGS